jgi:hypothetical protein
VIVPATPSIPSIPTTPEPSQDILVTSKEVLSAFPDTFTGVSLPESYTPPPDVPEIATMDVPTTASESTLTESSNSPEPVAPPETTKNGRISYK